LSEPAARSDAIEGAAEAEPPPLLVVISGPSGVGKDAVIARLRERGDCFRVPVTMTTRPPRPGERDGVDYIFVSPQEFARQLAAGELLEHAEVYGRSYGVPRAQLRRALDGSDAVLQVDVQGAATLRELLPEALLVFVVPDAPGRLAERLRARGADSDEEMARRLAQAEVELAQQEHFHHVLPNVEGDLDATVDALLSLIDAERGRPGRSPLEV
jgi:guanylate kinase